VVCDVSVDGGLQIDGPDEGPAFEASFGQRGEEALTSLIEVINQASEIVMTFKVVNIIGKRPPPS
jgi:hypothetical protein